jgi:hypothetical protein
MVLTVTAFKLTKKKNKRITKKEFIPIIINNKKEFKIGINTIMKSINQRT